MMPAVNRHFMSQPHIATLCSGIVAVVVIVHSHDPEMQLTGSDDKNGYETGLSYISLKNTGKRETVYESI